MIDFTFHACATCAHLQVIRKNGAKMYFCNLVTDDIPSGRVDPTVDADKCIKKGRYLCVK